MATILELAELSHAAYGSTPLPSNRMKTIERINDSAWGDSKSNRQGRGWLCGVTLASACVGIVLALYIAPVSAKTRHPHPSTSHTRIVGRYAAYPIGVGPNYWPPVPICKTLVADFNQFRDAPFASNNPRLSPQYPQFRRPDWQPMGWNPKLGEMVYSGCPNKACIKKNGWQQPWHYWEKKTRPLRKAGKPLLWRARVDLLGDGRHETIIRLTHFFPPNFVRGKLAPVHLAPYCRYIDSRLYMLPSPYPKMAAAFNNGPMSGWGISVTDLIQDVGNAASPYLSLAWTRSLAQTGSGMGMGVASFERGGGVYPYQFYPLCNIGWIPRGE